MNDKIYESIATLIVRANEIRKAEGLSAKNDYAVYGDNLKSGAFGSVGIKEEDKLNEEEYSAYLNRAVSADVIERDMKDEAFRLVLQSEYDEKIRDIQDRIADLELQREDGIRREEAEYQKQRDEKADYFYEKEQALKNQKKSSSGGSSGKSSSSSNKKQEVNEMSGASYINKMPAFNSGTSIADRLDNELFSKKFKEKALQISSNGTKKANKSELNALVKMAESYGASNAYIQWIHNVCGYG